MNDPILEQGYELDRLHGLRFPVRWWFFAHVPGDRVRNQRARRGVVDNGFRFARGGRCESPDVARVLLREAHHDAEGELRLWRGQPSHALSPAGDLIPLGPVEAAKKETREIYDALAGDRKPMLRPALLPEDE